MQLLVVGSIGFDSVETPSGRSDKALGGTAVFFSLAASYFSEVAMVAAIGTDFPQRYIAQMLERGIDLAGLTTLPGKTFHWGGRYHEDLNSRDTLFTHLNVFQAFRPEVPPNYRGVPYVFLGNIDPTLQLHVLDQIRAPKLVALDTMNYWIDGTPEALQRVLRKIDILFVNDEEAKQLSGDHNILRAAAAIEKMGPKIIIIKKGEHGALLIHEDQVFFAPAFPLEVVQDPTGAGDTFAGGFMGYIAQAGHWDEAHLRRAMIYGSTMASFAVEDFSVRKLQKLSDQEIGERFLAFHRLTHFDLEEAWQY